ncbi:hypothetical protein [Aurantiacibacter flavus]|uniref:Prepilin type IV endopeptidase peptidase domain-containing protein n=1 Tax=Aurantiacibacter flavus TaxID=3145232 RepID=A0ABV0D042_9SPHN
MLSIAVSLIWMLALIAAAMHLRDGGRTLSSALWAALGFALILPCALWLSPQPNWIAVLVTMGAIWRLIADGGSRLGPLLAGASAGLAAALVATAGIQTWIAGSLSAAALIVAFTLQTGRGSAKWRDEQLMIAVALILPVIGLSGDIVYGWQSAGMLGEGSASGASVDPPLWALAIVGLALAAGLVRGIWTSK